MKIIKLNLTSKRLTNSTLHFKTMSQTERECRKAENFKYQRQGVWVLWDVRKWKMRVDACNECVINLF